MSDDNLSGKKNILVAEDEKAYAHALVLKLQHAGYDAKSAVNGEEAMRMIKEEKFDLLFLDLIMPIMNGFDVLEALKKQNVKLPIIVLSNLGQPSDEEKVRGLGAIDFVNKTNTSILDVIKKVNNYMNSHK